MTCSGHGVLFPQLRQESNRGPAVAVTLLLSLPKHPSIPPRPSPGTPPSNSRPSRRTAGWSSPPTQPDPSAPTCPAVPRPPGSAPHQQRISWPSVCLGHLSQDGILHHESLPLGLISLEQTLLGPLEDKPQAVQPVQATASAQADAKAFQNKLLNHLLIPVGQFDARRRRRLLHRPFQLLLLRLVKGGGDAGVCSNIRATGPPDPKAEAHRPMVWGSRSSACAGAAAVQPWASSRVAYYRSHSRGVGSRIIRRRKSLTPICHCS